MTKFGVEKGTKFGGGEGISEKGRLDVRYGLQAILFRRIGRSRERTGRLTEEMSGREPTFYLL